MSGSDQEYMRRAIGLAATNVGLTGENPSVGCVIVAGGAIVGEAATAPGGRRHAEQQALEEAGKAARGATAYVTLEPCGRRSAGGLSCSELLAGAGVVRVIVACDDPSAFAAGQGVKRLRAAGIEVVTGVCASEASGLYATYRPVRDE